jgi:APA family basic amino acid/polyamine antiporter
LRFPDSLKDSDKNLVRGLGRFETTTLVVGGIIGTTIFLVTSEVAQTVGSPMLVLVTWLVAGLLAGAAALCFAELSAAIPETGGTYVFLRRAYGSDLISFGYAWMMCFAYGTGAIAVVAIMAATFLMPVLQALGMLTGDYIGSAAVILIVLLTLLNARGIRQGGIAQNVLTILKISLIAVLIIVPLIFADPQPARLFAVSTPGGDLATDLQNIGTAMILCLFSYSGSYFVTHVAEEVRDPQTNIPRSIVTGFISVVVLYLLVNVAYLLVLPFDEVTSSTHIASDLMAKVLGPTGAIATAFIIFCSAVGVLNAQLLNYPRIIFALARDNFFFSKIGEVNATTHAPTNAIIFVGMLSSLFAATGSYVEILSFVAVISHLFICLAVAAVIILRIREPDLHRPFRVWLYPFTPIAFLVVSAIYLGNLIFTRPASVSVGVAIVLAGLPFYWYWRKKARNEGEVV